MNFQQRKGKPTKGSPGGRKAKLPPNTLHGKAVQVSVDERVSDLVRRFPALNSALGSLITEEKKRIRDFPAPDQLRLLHMVYALKKASAV
jgi:hypothetical protein